MATPRPDPVQPPSRTRLSAPAFTPEAAAVYADAIQALDEAGVPYLLAGAVALNAHTGVWRDTKDLDAFIRPRDARRALDALRAAGFRTEVVYESWLGKAWRGDLFVDLIWRNANALFPVRSSWFERAAVVQLFGRELPVLPIEELLVSKMMVMGRFRFDGADMLHLLLLASPRIDWEHLADVCGEHIGVMLAHMHLFRWAYPELRDRVPPDVVARFTRLAEERESSFGAFRGRLLDIQSYEVDVAEWGMTDPHRIALDRVFGDARGRT